MYIYIYIYKRTFEREGGVEKRKKIEASGLMAKSSVGVKGENRAHKLKRKKNVCLCECVCEREVTLCRDI